MGSGRVKYREDLVDSLPVRERRGEIVCMKGPARR
jgi:hypothetical protein